MASLGLVEVLKLNQRVDGGGATRCGTETNRRSASTRFDFSLVHQQEYPKPKHSNGFVGLPYPSRNPGYHPRVIPPEVASRAAQWTPIDHSSGILLPSGMPRKVRPLSQIQSSPGLPSFRPASIPNTHPPWKAVMRSRVEWPKTMVLA